MYFFSPQTPYCVGDVVSVVREKGEGQVVLVLELDVRAHVVGRDAEHDRALALELAVDVADPARLRRAARRVVLGIEVEDDLLAAQVGELDRLAAVGSSVRNRVPACLLRPRSDPLCRLPRRC